MSDNNKYKYFVLLIDFAKKIDLILSTFMSDSCLYKRKPRAWCKTIVTTLFYITSYNNYAPSPGNKVYFYSGLMPGNSECLPGLL